jgi:hypothetical protein
MARSWNDAWAAPLMFRLRRKLGLRYPRVVTGLVPTHEAPGAERGNALDRGCMVTPVLGARDALGEVSGGADRSPYAMVG